MTLIEFVIKSMAYGLIFGGVIMAAIVIIALSSFSKRKKGWNAHAEGKGQAPTKDTPR